MENSPLISAWILHRPVCLWSGWLLKACLRESTQLRAMSGHTEYYSGKYSRLVRLAVPWALGFCTVPPLRSSPTPKSKGRRNAMTQSPPSLTSVAAWAPSFLCAGVRWSVLPARTWLLLPSTPQCWPREPQSIVFANWVNTKQLKGEWMVIGPLVFLRCQSLPRDSSWC